MMTRPGMIDDGARARAVTPTSLPFTARDRSGDLTAGRHPQARVPARQSARRTITPRVIGRGDRREPSAPPGLPGTRAAPYSLPLSEDRSAARVTGRAARGPDLPPGVTTATSHRGPADHAFNEVPRCRSSFHPGSSCRDMAASFQSQREASGGHERRRPAPSSCGATAGPRPSASARLCLAKTARRPNAREPSAGGFYSSLVA